MTVRLLTGKRETARTVSVSDASPEKDEEEQRDGTAAERVTNSLLMTIYRQFPLGAERPGLNPLSHFLLFIYPSPSSSGKFVTFA